MITKHLPGLQGMAEAAHLKITFAVSFALTSAQALLDHYVFNHSQWVQAIALAVIADTITGVWKSWKIKVFNSYKFGAVFTKAIVYAIIVFVLGGLEKVDSEIVTGIAQLGYAAILIREVVSLAENVEIIRPGTLPSWFTKRLKDFDDSGNYTGQPS